MKHHELKIDKCYADAKFSGEKPWEFRVNDRDFKEGDLVSYNVNGDPDHPLNNMLFQISYSIQVDEKNCIFSERYISRNIVESLDGEPLNLEEMALVRDFREYKAKGDNRIFMAVSGYEADLIGSIRQMIKEAAK